MKTFLASVLIAILAMPSVFAVADDLQSSLKTLKAVGPKGAGNEAAQRAWRKLAQADVKKLPEILAALDDANPLAANWIGTAIEAIAQREVEAGGKLPTVELERFVLDTNHVPKARRLAFESLSYVDHSARDRLIPNMLDDPSLEMRRDAVARLVAQAEKTDEPVALYKKTFDAARDADQVKLLAERLEKLGHKPDLARHYGFILGWKVIGPFDNTGEKGFAVAYPPESKIDTAAEHQGKQGKVKWIDHTSDDDHGKVDLNKLLGKEKGAVGYATCVFNSSKQQQVQIRVTSFSAVKLWINGREVAAHEVYHGGSQLDQYVDKATLKAGKNIFLLKVCQNEQTESWAEPWGFQLRVCDEVGTAILDAKPKP